MNSSLRTVTSTEMRQSQTLKIAYVSVSIMFSFRFVFTSNKIAQLGWSADGLCQLFTKLYKDWADEQMMAVSAHWA